MSVRAAPPAVRARAQRLGPADCGGRRRPADLHVAGRRRPAQFRGLRRSVPGCQDSAARAGQQQAWIPDDRIGVFHNSHSSHAASCENGLQYWGHLVLWGPVTLTNLSASFHILCSYCSAQHVKSHARTKALSEEHRHRKQQLCSFGST